MTTLLRRILPLFVALLAVNGAYGADPASELRDSLPAVWEYAPEFQQSTPDNDSWWKRLNDPTLDTLIASGINNNFDVITAIQRVKSARAQLNAARAAYFPQISASGGWTKARTSGLIMSRDGVAATESYWSLGLSASWEIDVFGKVTAQARQAKASWQASKADYDAMMVSVGAEIASAYVQLRVWQAELIVANEHIASQERVVKIAEARHEAGLASALDVAQARTVYFSTVATIPGLENSINTALNSLATLLGIYADALPASVTSPRPLPDCNMIVATGIPADLLRRRPDVVAAERQMAAASAAVGVAKKEFLPSLSINGQITTSAHDGRDLFKRQSIGYSIAPSLTWTVFSGFSRRARVAEAKAELEVAWASYNSTVMGAVTEVDNAMSDYLASLHSMDLIANVVSESKKSLDLSTDLYKSGNSSFTNVADAQMSFLEYTNSLITAHGNALSALITLYRSLGGGWGY